MDKAPPVLCVPDGLIAVLACEAKLERALVTDCDKELIWELCPDMTDEDSDITDEEADDAALDEVDSDMADVDGVVVSLADSVLEISNRPLAMHPIECHRYKHRSYTVACAVA